MSRTPREATARSSSLASAPIGTPSPGDPHWESRPKTVSRYLWALEIFGDVGVLELEIGRNTSHRSIHRRSYLPMSATSALEEATLKWMIALGLICLTALAGALAGSAMGSVGKPPRACQQLQDCMQDQLCTSTCSYTTMMCDKGICKGGRSINCC